MDFQELVEDQIFSPLLVANALRTTKRDIAHTLGRGQNTFSRTNRFRAKKTQTRLRQMLEILNRVSYHTGSDLAAYVWFRAEPFQSFGGMTPDQLVREGMVDDVHAPISTGSWLVVTPDSPPRRCAFAESYIEHMTHGGIGIRLQEKVRADLGDASIA